MHWGEEEEEEDDDEEEEVEEERLRKKVFCFDYEEIADYLIRRIELGGRK